VGAQRCAAPQPGVSLFVTIRPNVGANESTSGANHLTTEQGQLRLVREEVTVEFGAVVAPNCVPAINQQARHAVRADVAHGDGLERFSGSTHRNLPTRIPGLVDLFSTMAKQPPNQPMHTWAISHIKGTPAVTIGRVEAPDAESAIEEAIKRFGIKERIRDRLAARRVS
jgi:hypothetical protein